MDTFAVMFLEPTVLLTVITIGLICWFLLRDSNHRLPPGPTPWPILGNTPYVLTSGKYLFEIFNELRGKYGDIVRLRMGPRQNLVVLFGYRNFHKGSVEMDAMTKFRPTTLRMVRKILGTGGVFLGNGEQHSTLRKFSMGAFREFGLGRRSLEEKIQTEAKCLCDLMREQNGKPSDNFMTFKKAVSNVISNIIYGTRNDYDDPDFLKAIESIDVFFTTLSAGAPENFLPFLDKLPYSRAPRLYKAMDYLEQYAHKKIAEHRKTFDPDNIRDFVDIFLEHEKETKGAFTEDNLFRIIVDFYNAGTDTTALTIHWTILFLLKNPRVQQKLRRQINEVVGDSEVCMAHRDSLPYLQAVIHETLRMACIAPVTAPHTVLQDVEFDNYIIPKHTIIFFSVYSIMYDPDVWTNPHEFRPERFLAEDGTFSKVPEQFAPFGMGSRSCLGKQLAKTELFLFLGSLFQQFEFKYPGDPTKLSTRIHQTGITSHSDQYDVCSVPARA